MLRVIGSLMLAAVLWCAAGCGHSEPPEAVRPNVATEVRGTWVVRTSIARRTDIQRVVEEARQAGINTLLVQVRGRGDAMYRGGLEPPAAGLPDGLDPLREITERAHAAGLAVHAWINVNLVANASRPNSHPLHVMNRHPDWLMVPEALARDLVVLPPGDDRFRSGLIPWVEAHKTSVEGLYADPAIAAYRRHVADVCRDVVTRYGVDGIHLDYIRYPNASWGYSRAGLDAFRLEVDRELDEVDRGDMAARLLRDPLVYTRRYPVRWMFFRRGSVSRLVEEVSRAVRASRGGVVLSAAVFPDIAAARDDRFQDWTDWIARGWLDVVCPMNYATVSQDDVFERRVRAALAARGRGRVWMGIGAWRIPLELTIDRVRMVRRSGGNGVVLFSHGGLQALDGAFGRLGSEAFQSNR